MVNWFHDFLPRRAEVLGRFRGLLHDRGGSVVVYVALAIIPLVGFVGIGTDTARAYMVKSRLSSALDAAGLAGGRVFFSPTRDDQVRKYFNVNFPSGYMDSTLSGPEIIADEENESLSVKATATIPTTFMNLFGFEDVKVSAEAEVTRQLQILDVVLAMDMSKSMTWSDGSGGIRIDAAQDAATNLVNILFGDDATKEHLMIGLVPWNGKVNITINESIFDEDLTTSETVPTFINPETGDPQTEVFFANNSPIPLLEAPHEDWKGCVFSRFIDDEADGEAPDPGNDADTLYGMVSVPTADWVAWQPIGPEGEPVSGGTCEMTVDGRECRPCLEHGILPLQHDRQPIVDAIDSFTHPDGTTNITQGLGWAWRVLMPPEPFTEADPDPEFKRQQAIVLLTDGENFGGPGDGYKGTWGYGSPARPEMDARLLELAGNIKNDGVIIYVIQFYSDAAALETLLKQVAEKPDPPYYYYAPDGATLQDAFHEIANHLSELRLSK